MKNKQEQVEPMGSPGVVPSPTIEPLAEARARRRAAMEGLASLPRFTIRPGKSLIDPGVLACPSLITKIRILGEFQSRADGLRETGLPESDPALAKAQEKATATLAEVASLVIGPERHNVNAPAVTEGGRPVSYALLTAAAIGQAGLVELLLAAGADPSVSVEGPGLPPILSRGNSLRRVDLAVAMEMGMPDVAKAYRESGVLTVPPRQRIPDSIRILEGPPQKASLGLGSP